MNFVGINAGDVVRVVLNNETSLVGMLTAFDEDSLRVDPYDNEELDAILGNKLSAVMAGYKVPTTAWSVSWPTVVANTFIREIIILKNNG